MYEKYQSIPSGDGTPSKDQKAKGLLRDTDPDPLKYRKATKPAFNVWAIISPPAKHHSNGVSLAGQ